MAARICDRASGEVGVTVTSVEIMPENSAASRRFAQLMAAPHQLYTLIAVAFGVIFVFVTPPAGGPDEPVRLEMIYDATTGAWSGAETWPAGFDAFDKEMYARSFDGRPYTAEERARLRNIPLDKDQLVARDMGARRALRVHNPLASLPYAPVMALGLALAWSPMTIFMACKLISLMGGIALMRTAIRIMPARQHILAFVALFPTSVFILGTVNFDALLIGASFLFFAVIAAECAQPDSRLSAGRIVLLLALGVYIAAAKTPNAFFPLVAVLLPLSKFSSRIDKYSTVALCAAPGILVAVGWALYVRSSIVGDIAYAGPMSDYISPAEQFSRIIADPLAFAMTLLRTLAQPEMLGRHMAETVGFLGWNQVMLPGSIYALALGGGALLLFSTDPGPRALSSPSAIVVQIGLFMGIVVLSLFFLYLQWTGVGAPKVEGFQGRYLVPILPLLLCWPPGRMSVLRGGGREARAIIAVSVIALTIGVLCMVQRYWG